MSFRKLFTISVVLIGLFVSGFLTGCATDAPVNLTILHLNDAHGRTDAEGALSQMANDLKARGQNVLIFDAGDRMHGQLATNLSQGESMINVMNTVGYSAMAIGNHEFNFGRERLNEMTQMTDFPMLAANVTDESGRNVFQQYEVFRMNGVTVGVFGIASPETPQKSDPRSVAGLTFGDPAATARAMVQTLRGYGVDVIIALTHLGDDAASLPAHRSDAVAAVDGIDVVIDGHSHTLLENGKMVGNTLVAQTGDWGRNIGVVEMTVQGGSVSAKLAYVVPVNAELSVNPAIAAVIADGQRQVDYLNTIVVGRTAVELDGARENVRTRSTNLGVLITDAILHATGADVAVVTGGNIRASIPAGDITLKHVYDVLPFFNLLVTVEVTGADIMAALEHGVARSPETDANFPHFSGLSFEFDAARAPGSRVTSVTMANGTPLNLTANYTLATSEFLQVGGDGYTMFGSRNLMYYGGDAEAFAEYIMFLAR